MKLKELREIIDSIDKDHDEVEVHICCYQSKNTKEILDIEGEINLSTNTLKDLLIMVEEYK